ncbi:methionine synthase [Prochlorococcus sp. MIT 0601]|uniref:methionine synthase n=1 Tax=Prochlorococcus sp. MIT 0601 TaxID=1499498 RepID=UPI00053384C6|nr:methionine synthase [Prochlorococcus sp. MIT 0601]KGG12457.1 5-methyltetrahydrofolate--homocysteine methyltransferase [Prochlorococcus sp. MIT 0601]
MDFRSHLSKNNTVLVFDGAMGTALQQQELTAKQFGGNNLEGCNEALILNCPSAVEKVHRDYLHAGCDVIETNTFGATSVVLSEYGLESQAYNINLLNAKLAKSIAAEFSTVEKPRFVAGSIGPTTKLPSLGHITFDEMTLSYKEQIESLLEGGVDLLIVETCQDVLQIKSALKAIYSVQKTHGINIPKMVSITMETTGTMLIGTEISAALTILEPFDIDILGLNCATGPEQMKVHIKYLSKHSPFITSCIPNAGLPENVGGKAHYRLKPLELKMQLMHFINDLGVRVVGGCCGTTPEHIRSLCELVDEVKILNTLESKSSKIIEPSASSIYEKTNFKQDNSFLIIGERLNASGSKKVRELLNNDDWDGLVSIAKNQLKENAHILDVNVDYVGRDGVSDMHNLVSKLVTNINLPLMLDSTDSEKMESGLKIAGGKCILNSTNFEDGPTRFLNILDLAKTHGSSVVIGTIDEDGMARTSQKKFTITQRSYEAAINYGIKPSDLFFDPLVLPITTGIEEDRSNAKETITAIQQIKSKFSDVNIVLGISNVSFGLTPPARATLNSVFLSECIKAGLDSAIISPSKIIPLNKIKKENLKICLDLIYDKRVFKDTICTYDPLTALTTAFDGVTNKSLSSTKDLNLLPIDERLKTHIIEGEKQDLKENLFEALRDYKPLEIVNTFLLDGMKVVGELFGSGQMQLPFVLQSAETMKYAVSILEPYMEKTEDLNSSKGKFLIATVKGDVHDIGKNLVDIILSNNGYEVINLGIKQDISLIIEAQKKFNADCIAMSGLLVKSTAFMKDNLQALNKADISVPVILGGAALTPKFVNQDCNSVYNGVVIYGKDAFTDLRFMDLYMSAKSNSKWDNLQGFLESCDEHNDILPKASTTSSSNNNNNKQASKKFNMKTTFHRSSFINIEPSISPPFTGSKVIQSDNLPIDLFSSYLDLNALFSSQWQLKRTKNQSKSEYQDFLSSKAVPILNKWLLKIQEEKLVNPSLVYGYFPCGRFQNSLKVFDEQASEYLGEFQFPRQKSGNRLCISDFFSDLRNDKPIDFLPMQAVTMGHKASEFAEQLFRENKYTDYLYFHGLIVQLAEALAEYNHSLIRKECGFSKFEPAELKAILAQKYRGCRYSFGYPACPTVSDSSLQLKWLEASRIGLSIDETDQLHPEQSTTAIIALHSQAKYFSA